MRNKIKIGTVILYEKIKLNGNIAQLTFWPANGKWNAMYIYHDKETNSFDKFSIDFFSFDTLESCASSLLTGLKYNGYAIPKQ